MEDIGDIGSPIGIDKDGSLGFKWIFRGILAGILFIPVHILWTFYGSFLLERTSPNIEQYITFNAIIALAAICVEIFSVIALFVGVSKLKRTKAANEHTIKKDLDTSISSLIIYSVITVMSLFFSTTLLSVLRVSGMDLFRAISIELGLMRVVWLASLAAWTLAIILPIRRSVPSNSRNRLYSYAILVLILHLCLDGIVVLQFFDLKETTIDWLVIILQVIGLVIGLIPLGIYLRKIRLLEGRFRRPIIDRDSSFLQEERFPRFIKRDLERPWTFMVYATVIGIVMAIPVSLAYYHLFTYVNADHYNEMIITSNSPGILSGDQEFSDLLTDGETMEYIIEANGTLLGVSAVLTWTDETGGARWTNEPDGFRIDLSVINGYENTDSMSDSGINDDTGFGRIGCSLSYNENEVKGVSELIISITLEVTGDYSSKPFGLMSRADDSNDYTLTVSYAFIPSVP